jgi:hypothetical protein
MGSAVQGFPLFPEPEIPFSTEAISDILEIISLYGKRNISFPPGKASYRPDMKMHDMVDGPCLSFPAFPYDWSPQLPGIPWEE